jgi:hypothetical protein
MGSRHPFPAHRLFSREAVRALLLNNSSECFFAFHCLPQCFARGSIRLPCLLEPFPIWTRDNRAPALRVGVVSPTLSKHLGPLICLPDLGPSAKAKAIVLFRASFGRLSVNPRVIELTIHNLFSIWTLSGLRPPAAGER